MKSARWPMLALPAAAVLVAAWSTVPLSIWWDGADPRYFSGAWQTWGWGSLIAALALALALALTGGRADSLMLELWRRVMRVRSGVFAGTMAALLAALTIAATLLVLAGNPRNVDGFAQLFQARMFLAGRAWMPPPAELANFGTLQMILGPDKWYSQYPPGQSAVLAAGLAAGAWWLLNPLFVALLALATYRVARWCAGEATARLTLILLCASPFIVVVAGSEMSHLGAATLGMAAAAAATLATERRPLAFAALAGLALGGMTAFRPLDAVAAAVPVGAILWWWCAPRGRALAVTAATGVLGSLPTLLYNGRTTGSWHTFGYTVLWGPQHSLGFHAVPFGTPLTLTRAIARTGMDFHQLNMYLLDSTLPILVVLAAAFVLGRKQLGTRDSLPFLAAGALSGLLFFYWHRDVFYGPRFLYSAVAWYIILLARALALLRRSAARAGLLASAFVISAIVVGLVANTPGRLGAYRRGTPLFSLHPDRAARAAGIARAVVVIPDGWGTRLIVRMWQQGVSVRRSTRVYAAIDACTLEQVLSTAERDSVAHERLLETLDSLVSLKQPGVRAGVTADENLRIRPGDLPAECAQEITVDRRGYYSFAPFLYLNRATLDGDIVWARDLGPGNAALFRRYAGRRLYR
ncbi:MAG: hypothetical protein ACHQU1_12640, partial [Gemmatimonadales bacterium]